jgi:hypothetical protein
MRARFKANIGSGSARCIAGCGESHRLCMRPPARLGPAAPNDNALRNDDAANRRVGVRDPPAALGQSDCR